MSSSFSSRPFPSTGIPSVAPTSAASSPTSSPTTQGTSDSSSANATLYLYTFLATLVLLLAVSSAIVIRSLILRRRHHRLVEEAIRTGTWLPHRFESGRRRRDIGQKPKLWEAWLNDDDEDGEENEKRKWGDLMPVSAAYVNPSAPSPQGPTTGTAEDSTDPSSRPARFIRPFTRRRSPPSPQLTAVLPVPAAGQIPPLPSSSPTPAVHVAVLIAMPNPSQKQHGDESGPPVIEIGVVEANVMDDETETPSSDGS